MKLKSDFHIAGQLMESHPEYSIKKEDVQMAVCNWRIHEVDCSYCTDSDIGIYGKIPAEQLRKIISAEDVTGGGGYPWNRVIDWKKVMESGNTPPMFPCEVRVYEDKIWIISVLDSMKEVLLIPDVKYHYIINQRSLSHRKASDRLWDFLYAWEMIDR